MENWTLILLLIIFNSIFGAIWTLRQLKSKSIKKPFNCSVTELKVAQGDTVLTDYIRLFVASTIVGLFALRNLLFSPLSILVIYAVSRV